MRPVADWNIKLFADGANREEILALYRNPLIKGFTTNPTLMRKAGVADYESFARGILSEIKDRPISLEVFADDFTEMERQAHKLAAWGKNVYVKVPVTNTKSESSLPLIKRLAEGGIPLNVTALMTVEQSKQVIGALAKCPSAFVSVFAGRVADTGRDPIPVMAEVVSILKPTPHIELIWASPRELLNLVQAESVGCHVITATPDILKKIEWIGRDLDELSLDTVKMFHRDAAQAGFQTLMCSMKTSHQKSTKLELGVGERPTEGYLHQDISDACGVALDFTCAPWEIAVEENSLSEVLALGVMEHLRFEEVGKTVAHLYKILAPGGSFYFDVPDMKVWSEYLYNLTHGRGTENPCTAEHVWRTFYGWQRWPGDEHKSGWTREEILPVLKDAGFSKIEEGVNLLLAKGIERRRFTRAWDAHLYFCATK